ncbi:PaaI family thioesterase [Sphingomonas sp. ID0503]|uniref:PaaI family thioesterase n=1 Tax=Sphingomonas sp. ID0503 TaxID=3399691 RepID=UPI003AFAE29E
MSAVPDDGRHWEQVTGCGAFADHVGPLYMTLDALDAGEAVRFGFRVADHHCNPRPICHGGMLSTFADIALARGIRVVSDIPAPLPTITMSLDYLAPAPLGAWVDARVSVTRIGGGTCFAQALMYAGETPVLRASGVYKRMKPAT